MLPVGVALTDVLQHFTAKMFYSTDAGHEGVWRVGIGRKSVFLQSFVVPRSRGSKS